MFFLYNLDNNVSNFSCKRVFLCSLCSHSQIHLSAVCQICFSECCWNQHCLSLPFWLVYAASTLLLFSRIALIVDHRGSVFFSPPACELDAHVAYEPIEFSNKFLLFIIINVTFVSLKG